MEGTGRFRVYGVEFASDFPFQAPLSPGRGEADLEFCCVRSLQLSSEPYPLYRNPVTTVEGAPALELDAAGPDYLLRVAGVGQFLIQDNRILGLALRSDNQLMEIAFLGSALSLWMELKGIPIVHAATVEVEGQATAFLAGGKVGKSTLAASFMSRGHRLISDDLMALRLRSGGIWIEPGYPQMRMWPDQVDKWVSATVPSAPLYPGADKRGVPVGEGGFGLFCDSGRPLGRVVIPRRRPGSDGTVELAHIPPSQAVLELTRYSFLSRTVVAAGLQARRFEVFAEVAGALPFQELDYPSGLNRLDEVYHRLQSARLNPSPDLV